MRYETFLLLFFTLLLATESEAKIKKDTLYSASRQDKVIVSSEISREGDAITISFIEARKILGESIAKKYKKQDEIDIVFFDKTGVYKDMTFEGMSPKAFMIPSNEIEYTKSVYGYFLMKQKPILSFRIKSDNPKAIYIPIYLAHHEKKGVYKILTKCNDIVIELPKAKTVNSQQNTAKSRTTKETVTTTEELGESMPDFEYEALKHVNYINVLISKSEMTERDIKELDESANQLRNLSFRQFSNEETEAKVNKALSDYKNKREELDDQAKLADEAAARKAEEKARLIAEKEQARQDSIATAAKQEEEEEKQKNRWMIIGGIILAVVGFAGNQLLQHYRNKKNQENISKMQTDAIKQAEKEAKRRAEGYAKEQAKQARSAAKPASDITSKSKTSKPVGKRNNKGISI